MKATQLAAKRIGESGCYFLSIIQGCIDFARTHLFQTLEVDIIDFYFKCLNKSLINFDCEIKDLGKIVRLLLKLEADGRHESLSYQPKENEIEISMYERIEGNTKVQHFVITRDNHVLFDPYGSSLTVVLGKPVSKRIITIYL